MKKTSLLSSILMLSLGFSALNASAQVCFSSPTAYQAGSAPYYIVNADFNADGKIDLAVANQSDNNVSVYLGTGTGTFGPAANVGVGNSPYAIATGDFNGDTKLDIATANYGDNTVSILLGNGTGGFSVPVNITVNANNPESITCADFNGDNKKDLAVSYNSGGNISILIGNGTGGFAAPVNVSSSYWYQYAIAASDLNGDGKSDLVIADEDDGSITVLMGNGNGTFQSAVHYSVGSCPTFVSITDINGDTKKDLVISSDCGGFMTCMGNGDGTFQGSNYHGANSSRSNAVADFNGDGLKDVAIPDESGYDINVYLGTGGGNFGGSSTFTSSGDYLYSITTADFNGDGKVDFATADNDYNQASVFLGSTPPTVVANASATTICPGSTVVLTGSGVGSDGTVTYDITQNDLQNVYNNCNDGRGSYSSYFGFNWNDNLPAGYTVKSVSVQFNNSNDDYNWYHNVYLNGYGLGSVYNGYYNNPCSSPGNPADHILSINPSSSYYNVGSTNNFRINTYGYWYYLSPNPNWPSGVYARVTVTYSPYSWSGGVNNGVAFNPGGPGNYAYSVSGSTAGGCSNTSSINITVLPSINNTVNTAGASCVCNGTADVAASGGTAPFSYLWSTGSTSTAVTGLCAGNFTVTTTDAKGCKQATTSSISSSPSMSFSASSNNASCLCNGTSSVTVTGGTGPYVYSWSTGATTSAITGLCAGSYTLTATDSYSVACANSTIVTIASTPALSFNTLNTPATCTASCNGGASTTVTGGVGPYTYAWSPSGGTSTAATGLCAGVYTLTVTDANGCTNIDNPFTIGTAPVMVSFSNISANCSTSCTGSSTASVSGGTGPYTYAWAPSGGTNATATGLCGGNTYSLTVTSSEGCAKMGVSTIASNPVVMVSSFNNTVASCKNVCNATSTPVVANGVGPYTYSWAPAGGTNATATGLCEGGSYTVTVTDANGCSTKSTTTIPVNNNTIYINYIDENNASCNSVCNGWATVYPANGQGSYTYSWSNGSSAATATGLCGSDIAGITYTVTVTDGLGCSTSDYTSVWSEGMSVNGTTVGTTCNISCDGAATITSVNGGVAPYTYLWSTGATTASVTNLCAGTYSAMITITDSLGCKSSQDVTIPNNDNGVSLDYINTTNTFCNSKCTGTASGIIDNPGTPPYKYLWSNGGTTVSITGLCAGNYQLVITDAKGCSDIDDDNVYTNSNLNFSMNETDATCDQKCNGMIVVSNVSGGAGPYSYQWSPNVGTTSIVTGLCGDSNNGKDYYVTVTDVNGCTATDYETIYTDYYINLYSTRTDAACNSVCNGKDSIFVSGNSPAPFTYLWSNGATTAVATGLCGDWNNGISYTVTVTDANGCKGTRNDWIYANSAPMAVTTSEMDPTCNAKCNGTSTAMVNGGSLPITYQWLPSGGNMAMADSLCAGTYTLNVTDAMGCKNATVVTVKQPTALVTNVTVGNPTSCIEGNGTATANMQGGTPPYSYAWTPTGQIAATAVALASGTYSVTVMDANGCSVSGTGVVSCTSGINEAVTLDNVLSVYPNPSNGNIVVEVSSGNIQSIQIDNMLGQTVNATVNERHQSANNINVSAQPDGIYFIRVKTEMGTATKKLIISK